MGDADLEQARAVRIVERPDEGVVLRVGQRVEDVAQDRDGFADQF